MIERIEEINSIFKSQVPERSSLEVDTGLEIITDNNIIQEASPQPYLIGNQH